MGLGQAAFEAQAKKEELGSLTGCAVSFGGLLLPSPGQSAGIPTSQALPSHYPGSPSGSPMQMAEGNFLLWKWGEIT